MPKTAVNLRENDDEDQNQEESGKGKAKGVAKDVGGVAGQRLRAFLERIERLEEEKKARERAGLPPVTSGISSSFDSSASE